MTAIERSVWEYFSGKAEQKGRDLSELLTAAVATARFLCRGLFSSAISRSLSRSKTRSSSSDSGPVLHWDGNVPSVPCPPRFFRSCKAALDKWQVLLYGIP